MSFCLLFLHGRTTGKLSVFEWGILRSIREITVFLRVFFTLKLRVSSFFSCVKNEERGSTTFLYALPFNYGGQIV